MSKSSTFVIEQEEKGIDVLPEVQSPELPTNWYKPLDKDKKAQKEFDAMLDDAVF